MRHQPTPVHDDSFIAAKFVGTDFNSVSRNADASDITTPDVDDSETVLPTTEKHFRPKRGFR
jgi:hypothetical protein